MVHSRNWGSLIIMWMMYYWHFRYLVCLQKSKTQNSKIRYLMILYDKSKDTVHWGSLVSVPSPYLGAWSRAAELYYSHTFYCLAPSGGSDPFPHHTILGFAPFLPCLPDLQSSHFCRQRADFYLMQKRLCKCLNYIITEDHKVWTVMKSSIFGQTFHSKHTYQHILLYFNISLNINIILCIFKKEKFRIFRQYIFNLL